METQNSLLTLEALKKEILERQKNIGRLSKAFACGDGTVEENLNSSSGNDREPDEGRVTSEDIKLMEKITQWIIIRYNCKTKPMPDNMISRHFSVRWQHIDSKNAVIDQSFDEIIGVDETRQMSNLQIRISLTNGDDSGLIEGECASLVAHCCKTNNSGAFFSQMSNYRKLCNARQEALFELELEDLVEIEDVNSSKVLTIPIKTTSGTLLATFQWSIGFKPAADKMVGSYKVEFTPEGLKSGQENNLPEALLDEGHYSSWSASECLSNLKQIASFDD